MAVLAGRGLLGPETIVAHAVHVGPEERAMLADAGCAVAHCPRSNAQLGCGAAPLRELREAGVRLGLGTDSPASALTFDAFEEMRAAIATARTREGDPQALSAAEALELATRGGANALDRPDLGVLALGAAADLVAVELASTPFWPCDEPEAAYVYGGSPERVVLTVVAGDLRYRKGGPAYAAALSQASAARSRMLSNTT